MDELPFYGPSIACIAGWWFKRNCKEYGINGHLSGETREVRIKTPDDRAGAHKMLEDTEDTNAFETAGFSL